MQVLSYHTITYFHCEPESNQDNQVKTPVGMCLQFKTRSNQMALSSCI